MSDTLERMFDEVRIDELIEARLIPSGYPDGDMKKYLVDGYPGVLVRDNECHLVPDNPLQDLKTRLAPYVDLPKHGIAVPTAEIVEHKGNIYTFTLHVSGVNASELLRQTGDLHVEAFDATWAGLCKYYTGRPDEDRAWDIETLNNWKFGHTSDDAVDRLYMVDIGMLNGTPEAASSRAGQEMTMLNLANTITDIADATGTTLKMAQDALETLYARTSVAAPVFHDNLVLLSAARRVMDTGRVIDVNSLNLLDYPKLLT